MSLSFLRDQVTRTDELRAELLEQLGWHVERGHVMRPAWHAQAACRGVGTELFFSGRGETPTTYRKARELYCSHCPVVTQCREAGKHEAFGLWGGRPAGHRR